MSANRIEKFALANFRGSTGQVEFEFARDKSIVMIFGENGTGKTSIADAIDFVCNNHFGSLRNRSGTIAHKHVVAVEAASNDLYVELTAGGRVWRATLNGASPQTKPSDPPRAFVLRRSDITRVMEATPGDRYKALQAYITVTNVERAEDTLRKASKNASNILNQAADRKAQADEALERYWHKEGSPDGDALRWARRCTSENIDDVQARLAVSEQIWDGYNRANELLEHLRELYRKVRTAQAEVQAAEAALERATSGHLNHQRDLAGLLEHALHFLGSSAEPRLSCPLCGKPDEKAILVARVQDELARLHTIRSLRDELEARQSELAQVEAAERNTREQFIRRSHELADRLPAAPATLVANIDWSGLAVAAPGPEQLAGASRVLKQFDVQRVAISAAIERDRKQVNQHTALVTQLQIISEAYALMLEQEAVAARLAALLAVVEKKRKQYIARLIRGISGTVNQLYERLHPNEPLGNSALRVKPKTRGSLELEARFGNRQGVSPMAYYSESHLDTLGLCVYLALAKSVGDDTAIVVLDDVLTSVDEVHMERIMALIAEEAPALGQVIITTHSRAWFDRVRRTPGMDADLIELHQWDLTNGIRHIRVPA